MRHLLIDGIEGQYMVTYFHDMLGRLHVANVKNLISGRNYTMPKKEESGLAFYVWSVLEQHVSDLKTEPVRNNYVVSR